MDRDEKMRAAQCGLDDTARKILSLIWAIESEAIAATDAAAEWRLCAERITAICEGPTREAADALIDLARAEVERARGEP